MSTHLDEREVAARLAEGADALFVPQPRWEEVRRGMQRVRRRRRAKVAGAVAGAMASVVLLGAGVQTSVLPYPSWAPAAVLPASGSTSALTGQPTKGSLAQDTQWLSEFREYVASGREDESGGESWQVPSADDVDVIFAGDVAGHRLAAIEAPYRWGLIEDRQQVWFMGPEGASPAEMVKNQNGQPSDTMATQFGAGMGYGDADQGETGWLVLTPDERPVSLIGPPEYAADGTSSRAETPLTATEPGVYVWSSAEDTGMVSVRVDGNELYYGGGGFSVSTDVPTTLRGVALSEDAVASALAMLYNDAGLAGDGADPLALWGGGPQGSRAAVLALRTPSGALVVGAYHEDGQVEDSRSWLATDHITVLPATELDQLALAWQQHRMTWTQAAAGEGVSGSASAASTVTVVGPVRSTSAQLLDADGAVLATTGLEDGGAVVEAPDARSVRFLDDSGAVLAETEVRPWTDMASAPPWEGGR